MDKINKYSESDVAAFGAPLSARVRYFFALKGIRDIIELRRYFNQRGYAGFYGEPGIGHKTIDEICAIIGIASNGPLITPPLSATLGAIFRKARVTPHEVWEIYDIVGRRLAYLFTELGEDGLEEYLLYRDRCRRIANERERRNQRWMQERLAARLAEAGLTGTSLGL